MILLHGTTRQRAEAILQSGPDPRYPEGGIAIPPFGFYMMPAEASDEFGTVEDYARGKSTSHPGEGGPVILEVEVPDAVALLALVTAPIYCFDNGYGLEELMSVWHRLAKRIVDV
jgi:hypothetical protein